MGETAYRKEIDGLRAVAVVPVVLFHAGPHWLSGGYVGVDVFFVLSGFLITSILAAEHRHGTFTVSGFYDRRARRILPALFLVMGVSIPAALIWMLPDELRNFATSVGAVTLFSSNVLFTGQADYFEPVTETLPLLHTWSLAVEEQFYIVFPLLLATVWRFGPRILWLVLLVIAVASLAWAEHSSSTNPTAAFYLAPSRAWELMAGALLGLAMNRKPLSTWPPGWAAEVLAGAGLVLIAAAVFGFDDATRVPGVAMLLPVAGTLLVIAFATPRTLVGRLLAAPPIAFIGLISYSAYLWHVPLLAFVQLTSLEPVPLVVLLGFAALSFVLAALSWRYVERPFRDRARVTTRHVAWAATVAALCFLGFAVAGIATRGFATTFDPRINDILAEALDRSRYLRACNSTADLEIPPAKSCRIGTGSQRALAVLGDSHAAVLFEMIAAKANARGFDAIELTYNSCLPVVGFRRQARPLPCSDYSQAVSDYLAPRDDIVVMAARWTSDLEGVAFDNGEGGIEEGERSRIVPLDPVWRGDEAERKRRVAEAYAASVRAYLAQGKKVILVYPIPEVGWNVPRQAARRILLGAPPITDLSTRADVFSARNRAAYVALDAIGDDPNLARVKPEEIFCNSFVAGRCAAMVDGKAFYFDDDHLNNRGAALVAEAIVAVAVRWK